MRDRLTERVGDGIRYDNGKYIVTCYPKNDNLTPVDKLAAKLCDFEDKIENGDVIVPPCKVGDDVYLLPVYRRSYMGFVQPDKVQMIGITSRGIHIKARNHHDHNKMYMLGKTAFLTREEAEKALAEREGKNNG